MCNNLQTYHKRTYNPYPVKKIPKRGKGYKIMEMFDGVIKTPYRFVPVKIGDWMVWDQTMGNPEYCGFTFFTNKKDAKKLLGKTDERTYCHKLIICRLEYIGGLGKRFEPDPAIGMETALCNAYRLTEIIE